MSKKPRTAEESIGVISAQLENIIEKLQHTNTRLDEQEERFKKLEQMLTSSQQETSQLKELLITKDQEIVTLKNKINDVEMHQRSYNIRVFNFPLNGDTNDTRSVMQQVYEKQLRPVLEGAVAKGRIQSVPTADQLLETAHTLPGKDNKPKPIICRFFNRHYRTVFLQLRKEFAPKAASVANRPPPTSTPPTRTSRATCSAR
jgi:vacuolar-type H+-ATPase subunit I/STV1